MDKVRIVVPSSSANVGLGFDAWCLGLQQPCLHVTCTRQAEGIGVESRSPCSPCGRILGYAGRKALENFFRHFGIGEGVHLLYEDDGYPVGGLGRSGAEAVGAVLAAAVLFSKKLSREEVVRLSAKGEPGEHKDNVAGSTNGRFNIISVSPYADLPHADFYNVPENLGIAISYSSHEKTTGTGGLREVLRKDIQARDFAAQIGMISAATAALVTGNTDRFLEIVWGDRFHEPRRADIGGYGHFAAAEFFGLKRKLFEDFHVAMNVSGAGPRMHFLYNKDEHGKGIEEVVSPVVVPWFKERGVDMEIKPAEISREGAYDYAQREYGW